MKRLILTLAAAAALAAPLGSATTAFAESRHGGERHGDWNGGRWNGEHRGGERRWDGEGRRGERGWDGARRWGDNDSRWDRRDWDDRRHNGYWYNNRWFYGPPPGGYFGSPYYRPGYAEWRRGGFLPPYYRGWIVSDYGRYRLRRPPFGYHWVRIGGDYLLVSDRSSIIFDVIVGGY